jgi:ABC-type Fe3+-siderophore transport system permease subunit
MIPSGIRAGEEILLPVQSPKKDTARQRPRGRILLLLAGLAAVAATALLGVAWGSLSIPPATVAAMFWRRAVGETAATSWPPVWETVVFDIRLPRVILAALVGGALSQAGAVYQGLFRNPLADPYLIGISSGAGLGATIAIALGLPQRWGGLGAVPLLAFVGALGATTLVYILSRTGGRPSVTTLLLAGVALGAFLSSLTTFLMFHTKDAFQTMHIFGWLMGSFALSNWAQVWMLGPALAVGGALLWAYAHRLNVLQLDDEQAQQLGIPVGSERRHRLHRADHPARGPADLGAGSPLPAADERSHRSRFYDPGRRTCTESALPKRVAGWGGNCLLRCTLFPIPAAPKEKERSLMRGKS